MESGFRTFPLVKLTSYNSIADVGLPPDHPPQTKRISCGIRGLAIGFWTKKSFEQTIEYTKKEN